MNKNYTSNRWLPVGILFVGSLNDKVLDIRLCTFSGHTYWQRQSVFPIFVSMWRESYLQLEVVAMK